MATYNSEQYILETISTITSQSFKNWELIITDDCSQDSTVRLISELAGHEPRIKYFINERNSGAAVSRNRSLSVVKGDYVAFLDADDLWHKNKLDLQLKFMLDNNSYFSFTTFELIDKNGQDIGKYVDEHCLGEVTYADMLKKKATFGCSTVMIDIKKTGPFEMPLLRTGQDYATWLMLLKRVGSAQHCSEVLTKYRILPNSISRNKIKKARRQWQIYREVEQLNFFDSLYNFSFYAWRAVFRK